LLIDGIDLGQSQRCDEGTREALSWKIDGLAESAPQHCKTNPFSRRRETLEVCEADFGLIGGSAA
jgi:hypothetical protein